MKNYLDNYELGRELRERGRELGGEEVWWHEQVALYVEHQIRGVHHALRNGGLEMPGYVEKRVKEVVGRRKWQP